MPRYSDPFCDVPDRDDGDHDRPNPSAEDRDEFRRDMYEGSVSVCPTPEPIKPNT